jgi:trans-aconitate methyltransferase
VSLCGYFRDSYNGLRIRARRILPFIQKKYKNILDVGCAQGIFTFELARKFPESVITGIDINKDYLKEINKYQKR